jgi:hypothetical protein
MAPQPSQQRGPTRGRPVAPPLMLQQVLNRRFRHENYFRFPLDVTRQ